MVIYGALGLSLAAALQGLNKRRWFVAGMILVLVASLDEWRQTETHLIPLVLQAALGLRPKVTIFGTDYPTPDGTCVRDYIHVTDLTAAHVLALRTLEGGLPPGVYNLGNERGYPVREVVEVARRVTGRDFPVMEGDRRPGDPAVLVASSRRIREELGWRPRCGDLETILRTAWEWHRRHLEGYGDGTCYLPVAGGRLS
ncbi:NAD dependent epimerase/dehydratase family protein [Desulfofundulus thermosubterraneus DSM 16057]|uniref:UDP-glucose 4-epimerase n=1 Tax=Desulfofundulus thermosubterraneus DSM 16057 TaxID=1121432 RepID=A0A1M6LAU1_9FIRM|nr:NAD dependent epimerase/dehydratase family protein [Desulfofundulus thermosubterraneus DSM 16057]